MRTTLVLISAILLATSPGPHRVHAATQPGEDGQAAIAGVLKARAKAFEAGDQKALEALFVREPYFSVIEQGHANWGFADYRDHHLSLEMKAYRKVRFEMADLRIRASADMGWATYAYHLTGTFDGNPVDTRGLETLVLEKSAGRWRIVHFHESSPPKRRR